MHPLQPAFPALHARMVAGAFKYFSPGGTGGQKATESYLNRVLFVALVKRDLSAAIWLSSCSPRDIRYPAWIPVCRPIRFPAPPGSAAISTRRIWGRSSVGQRQTRFIILPPGYL